MRTADDFHSLREGRNVIDDFFETADRAIPLVLFGAGHAAGNRIQLMESHGFRIACLSDNDAAKWGTTLANYEVLSLVESQHRFPGALYVITSSVYYAEIYDSLVRRLDRDRVCSIDFDICRYFRGDAFREFLGLHEADFTDLARRLADDASRHALFQVVKGLISGRRSDFEAVCAGNQYSYDHWMKPHSNAVYIDCGAYDGDTLVRFCDAAGADGYRRIIAFEPDDEYFAILSGVVQAHGMHRVTLEKQGTWHRDEELPFANGGMGRSVIRGCNQSRFAAEAPQSIRVVALDRYLNGERADLIKMDIEGAEFSSLQGARQTIANCHPHLAVCIYHNMEDYIRIPRLVHDLWPSYRLFIRHHGPNSDETVLYATP